MASTAGLDAFLDVYGLAAVFALMLAEVGRAPVPIPGDAIMLFTAARATQGRLVLWQAFAAILLATVLGGLVQFRLARGPGRGLLYRYGRYLGLTATRLDAAGRAVKRGGALGISLAIVTPGARAAAVAACGLAGVPLRTFAPGLLLGNTLFLGLHFALGYLGGILIAGSSSSAPVLGLGALALLIVGLAAWLVIRGRQRPDGSRAEVVAEAIAAWHEATCPARLVLGAVDRARPQRVFVEQ